MAKPRKEKSEVPPTEVRYTAIMTPEDRIRLKLFCIRNRLEMERVGARWIMERLEQEEKAERKSK